MADAYKKNSITLTGAVAMGTGVMIGADIFALTGQIAELAGPLFPLSFVVCAIVTAFSAYSYIKMSNAYPSAGGIAMILEKAYGPTTVAAGASLLMALSMVINESLVARTFGTYTLRAFGGDADSVLVPVLGVGLIVFAYLVNASGTRSVGLVTIVMAVLKVGGRFRALGQRSVVRGIGRRGGCYRLCVIGCAVDPRFQGVHDDHE